MSRATSGVLAATLLVSVIGCARHMEEESEVEHHTPAHKPASFPLGVVRLGDLHREILESSAGEARSTRGSSEMNVFHELFDIAKWLPELAGDSDLREEPWDVVNATADQLQSLLRDVLAARGDEQMEVYRARATSIESLIDQLTRVSREFAGDFGPVEESVAYTESAEADSETGDL
jgi:hypothetical protein